jgi:hypothetical protein
LNFYGCRERARKKQARTAFKQARVEAVASRAKAHTGVVGEAKGGDVYLSIVGLAVISTLNGGVAAGSQSGLAFSTLEAHLVENLAFYRLAITRVHCRKRTTA